MLTINILNEGCYKDLPIRAMESLEGKDPILLDGNYASRDEAVLKCLLLGRKLGYAVVGVQDGGMCVGSAKVKRIRNTEYPMIAGGIGKEDRGPVKYTLA